MDLSLCSRCNHRVRKEHGGKVVYIPKKLRRSVDRSAIRRMRDGGQSVNDIAAAFDISGRRVLQILADASRRE